MNVKRLTFNGKIEKGEVKLGFEKQYKDFIRQLEGKEISLTVGLRQSDRTGNQNNFYWLYLNVIADETGDSPTSLHEYFKRKYLPPVFLNVLGKQIKIPGSTTKLEKLEEFSKYLELICVETGIPIPQIEY